MRGSAMRVVVGGGTGFVGRALTQLLRSRGHQVTHVSRQGGKDRISWKELSRTGLPLCDAVVNLAGENVLNPFRRWGDAFCKEVISSRVETTKTLAKAIVDAEQPPRAWVLVTGVGYYRPSPTAEYTEDSPGGNFDFFSRLVSSWETAALIPGSPARGVVVRSGEIRLVRVLLGVTLLWFCGKSVKRRERDISSSVSLFWGSVPVQPCQDCLLLVGLGVKVAFGQGTCSHSLLPTGVVLGQGGGAISQMLWPFRLGLGGPLGSGLQPFPWIHIRDLTGIVCHALENECLQGVLNGVAPSSSATSNGTFAQEFAAALGRPALLPVPAWAVRAVFGAERAIMLLEGQRVLPKRTLESGYRFIFPDLPGALKDIVA
ncbi:epimerase family protein SDR39U1 isoform X2 [Pithys albifrons albifrons]|uniref:epimerase family protein SDR39U1 isoform X2 n=1 Tax=Pithys albifrons albifrons TaxID=3385563 RepID=UPI003A5CEE9F